MIDPLKDDTIINKIGGRFKLTALMQKRWVELMQGSRPMIEDEGMSELDIIAREIMQEKVTAHMEEPGTTDEEAAAEEGESSETES